MAKKISNQCSFCALPKEQVTILIAGIDAYICNNCIEQAGIIVKEELQMATSKSKNSKFNLHQNYKPKDIKKYLDDYVIGQDTAKKVLAVAVYNHYKRLNQKVETDEVEIEKSNIIIAGRTGTGKTLLAKSIAKLLNVPFTIVDATIFTEAGYVGEDVESILTRLLQICDYDVNAAEKGIVFIDEIDKIARKGDNPSLTRDVKEGTQQSLLKILEGTDVLVPPQGGRKHPDQKMIKINTQNILFVCGGSFDGIDRIIGKRMQSKTIGFRSKNDEKIDDENLLQYITHNDLKAYGMIPELLGRVPVLAYLNPLDKVALKSIITEPKNALYKQFKKLFALENIELIIEDETIDYIVEKAIEYNLGARGLRSIFEAIMNDAMFEMPSDNTQSTFTITKKYATEKLEKTNILKQKTI